MVRLFITSSDTSLRIEGGLRGRPSMSGPLVLTSRHVVLNALVRRTYKRCVYSQSSNHSCEEQACKLTWKHRNRPRGLKRQKAAELQPAGLKQSPVSFPSAVAAFACSERPVSQHTITGQHQPVPGGGLSEGHVDPPCHCH